ncbi:MAG: lipoprotein signal peptidase [Mariniphaga sp.]|nr:lipoprotein signal peptidase [Mariniphaga sp.]MDD4225915.1 lipoprotein signal peptidase [Mariniphaga sp.]MDD4424376.1 lipoprotein signal peptidase [Mariniphaga sp.]
MNNRLKKLIFIIVSILAVDQWLKVWIKTNLSLGEEIVVFKNWFIIHFVENNGMAFGFEFAGENGKLFLSIFRILAVVVIGWYLFRLTAHKNLAFGFLVCIALIFSGAIGNIIDSLFYGLIFNHSYGQVAEFLPEGGGYASFLHGRVVDMFYFPIIQCQLPNWIPFVGGNDFVFFRPVFNIADSSITVGIFSILLFYRKQLHILEKETHKAENEEQTLKEKEEILSTEVD